MVTTWFSMIFSVIFQGWTRGATELILWRLPAGKFFLLGMKSFQSEHGPVYRSASISMAKVAHHVSITWRIANRDVCTQASRSTGVDKLSDYCHTVGGSCLKYLLLSQCPTSSQLATWAPQGPPKRWSRSNPAAGIPSMARRHHNWIQLKFKWCIFVKANLEV